MTPFLRSRWLRRLIGIALTAAAVAVSLGFLGPDLPGTLDRMLYDARLRQRAVVLDDHVVIIDTGAHGSKAAGQRAGSDVDLPNLLEQVFRHGDPAVVGVALTGSEAPAALSQPSPSWSGGHALVTGYLFRNRLTGQRVIAPEVPPGSALPSGPPVSGFLNLLAGASREPDGVLRAIPLLAGAGDASIIEGASDAAVAVGVDRGGSGDGHDSDDSDDSDGSAGQMRESFALAVLRSYLGNAVLRAGPAPARSAALRTLAVPATGLGSTLFVSGDRGQIELPLSAGHTVLVPATGRGGPGGGRFQYVLAGDVLAGDVDPSLFHDRIVLIGATAPGFAGLRATPAGAAFSDVEIHAALIAGALDGALLRRPAHAKGIETLLTVAAGVPLAFALPALGLYGALGATLIAALIWVGSHMLLWSNFGLVLPLTAPLAVILVLGLFNAVAGWFAEDRARRTMRARFGDYVSPLLVERMARDPVHWNTVESSHRELSILFADVRGFTRIAETVQPEILRDYLTSFLTAMTEVIHSHHGTVDKYMGDAVMAFWGAPIDDPAHADHAVAAALAMQREVERLSASFVLRGLPPLAVGIGINTGIVRVGNMGSLLRRTYTVIGDAVNLASRLESLTRRHEVPIIVGEATARQCRLQRFGELGRSEIAGRSESVRIFVPLAAGDVDERVQEPRRRGAGGQRPGRLANQTLRQPVSHSTSQSAKQSVSQSMSQSMNESVSQSPRQRGRAGRADTAPDADSDHPPARRQQTGRLHEGTGSGL